MKRTLFTYLLFLSLALQAQDAIHNFGNIQVHGTALVGFHTDVINDGTFDQNLGLVGFYGENRSISLSGAFSPVFFDTEIATGDGFFLDTTMGVTNNASFISGNVITPRDQTDIYLNFLGDAFYVGEGDNTKIDGFGAISNRESFTFPVGDDDRLRPLTLTSAAVNALAKCAYFFEDPNAPSTFNVRFDTDLRDVDVLGVSTQEFWRLEGQLPATVTLSWDNQSDIIVLGETLNDLKVVGWSKTEQLWVNLGNTAVQGSMNSGTITSDTFVPDDYEIITLGGNNDILETMDTIELGNYFLTPNGDGQNDFLVIEGLENSPNNTLQIFNRYGVLVYKKDNYTNEFNGRANVSRVIDKDAGLPAGIYFYIIALNDLRQKHQGYMYITQ
ncbi:gliding motility-associated C-terminal domain-containing protein [Flavobacteriaceae bacterium 3-367]